MKWDLVLANPAVRDLRSVPRRSLGQLNEAIEAIRVDPHSGDIKVLRGTGGVLRRRVGAWRILYELDRERGLIVILGVKRRSSNTY
jgi:mRNA-degrading endonuclease RelE of RelBE toxin-antitoxin system